MKNGNQCDRVKAILNNVCFLIKEEKRKRRNYYLGNGARGVGERIQREI